MSVLFRINLSFALISLITSNLYASSANHEHAFHSPLHASAIVTKPYSSQTNNQASYMRSTASMHANTPQTSDVVLMNIPLNASQKHILQTFKSQPIHAMSFSTSSQASNLPAQTQLGMNNVPVLDQGMHGSCVTFATIGALDALYSQGNYLSPLCSLELGSYLENRSYIPSGWEGSFGPLVLERLDEFGVVTMADQLSGTCAGVKEYPVNDMNNEGKPISLDDYANISVPVNFDFHWYPLLTVEERFAPVTQSVEAMDKVLTEVKEKLASYDAKDSLRLTFGVLLPVYHCSAGACAKYHQPGDTWAITNEIRNDKEMIFGGHEMIITGYDDNAIAIDNEGVQHKGLLTLRNSWGDRLGDNGNYYMTYDFFKQYAMEVQVIRRNYSG